MKKVTIYEEPLTATDELVIWLWEVLEEMSPEDQRLFINFTSGQSRLPLSIQEFKDPFKIKKDTTLPEDKFLPRAQTCFFTLFLAPTSSKKVLRKQLLYSIHEAVLIDNDFKVQDGGDAFEEMI